VPTTLRYRLSGCANGHPLSIGGSGTIDGGRLHLAVRAETAPLDFDAAIAALACVDPLLAVAAGVVEVPEGELIVFRCHADFLTEGGAEVGAVVARGVVEMAGDGLDLRAQLADARLAHEVGEMVVAVPKHEIVICGTCLFADRVFQTNRGREEFVTTTTRLYGIRPAALRAVAVGAAQVSRRAGARLELALAPTRLPAQ